MKFAFYLLLISLIKIYRNISSMQYRQYYSKMLQIKEEYKKLANI